MKILITYSFFRVHQASTGLDILQVVKISQAQAWQRAGRAGRDSEGNCYRMLTRNVRNLLHICTLFNYRKIRDVIPDRKFKLSSGG